MGAYLTVNQDSPWDGIVEGGAAVSSSFQASPGKGGNSTLLSPSWLHQGKGNSTVLSRLLSQGGKVIPHHPWCAP